MSLDITKASGPESIDSKVLKIIAPTMSCYLAKIINLSFESGCFPDCLKSANIIPVFKKDSKILIQNYRPISLLSNISKIIEKIMFSRIYSFLDVNKSLYNLQFGFRAKHSTIHALIQITEKIRAEIDNNNYACGIFLDLQKAFDTVDHNILINKLSHCVA